MAARENSTWKMVLTRNLFDWLFDFASKHDIIGCQSIPILLQDYPDQHRGSRRYSRLDSRRGLEVHLTHLRH